MNLGMDIQCLGGEAAAGLCFLRDPANRLDVRGPAGGRGQSEWDGVGGFSAVCQLNDKLELSQGVEVEWQRLVTVFQIEYLATMFINAGYGGPALDGVEPDELVATLQARPGLSGSAFACGLFDGRRGKQAVIVGNWRQVAG